MGINQLIAEKDLRKKKLKFSRTVLLYTETSYVIDGQNLFQEDPKPLQSVDILIMDQILDYVLKWFNLSDDGVLISKL